MLFFFCPRTEAACCLLAPPLAFKSMVWVFAEEVFSSTFAFDGRHVQGTVSAAVFWLPVV